MPRLSVCLIARDEAAMLPDCLASLEGVADEVVLVDTGSADATVDIARRAGAHVVFRAWDDDFAAARNASLDAASGDWVLILDADERLAPGAGVVLRRAIATANFDCGMLPLHDASRLDAPLADVLSGARRTGEPKHLPRLLRKTGDLRFTGIIHESVLPWLSARGMKLAFVEAPLIHFGGVPEVRQSRKKSDRNITLLERLAASSPNDVATLGYLAHEYFEAGRRIEARAVADQGFCVIARRDLPPHVSVLRLATARARMQLEANDATGVLETVDACEAVEGAHPDFDFLRGTAHEIRALGAPSHDARRTELRTALSAYERALAQRDRAFAQAFVIGARSHGAHTRRGLVLLQLGGIEDAKRALDAAVASRPDSIEARFGIVECALEAGDTMRALSLVEPLLNRSPDGWLLAAACFDALGMLDDFTLFLARARERSTNGYVSPHRRDRHVALHAAACAYAGKPTGGPGPIGVLGALLAHEPIDGEPLPADRALVRRFVRNLLQKRRLDAPDALLDARAESAMPGLPAIVLDVLAELRTASQPRAPHPVC